MRGIAILSTIWISLISFQSAGQQVFFYGNSPEFQKFKNSTLAVVQTGIESYDDFLLNVMEEYWTFNKYVLIDSNEIDEYIRGDYHLMMILQNQLNGLTVYEELTILQENPEFKGNLMKSNAFASVPLDHELEKTPEDLELRLPYIIKTLNDLVSYCETTYMKKSQANSFSDTIETYLNRDAYKIADLTLLVPSYLFEEREGIYAAGNKDKYYITRELMESYPYPYKIMDWDNIIKLQEDPDQAIKYCLFMPIQSFDKTTTHIYDLNTRQTLFYTENNGFFWYTKIVMRNVMDDLKDYIADTKK